MERFLHARTGEAGATTKSFCEELGATAYFEKPIDFEALRNGLEKVLQASQPERRSEVRIRLRVMVSLRGTNLNAKPFEDMFEEQCVTENVSRTTFFCTCKARLTQGSEVAVSLVTGGKKFLGLARVVRCEDCNTPRSRYAFRFVQKDVNWILQ